MAIFTLKESDAHLTHQSTQQMIDSIMQAIEKLLKQLKGKDEKDKDNGDKKTQAEEGPVLTPTELAEPTVSIEFVQPQQALAPAGDELARLSAAAPHQLEGQPTPALLPPAEVKIQVGETSIQAEYGDELQNALMQFSPAQLAQLQQATVSTKQADIQENVIDVEWEASEYSPSLDQDSDEAERETVHTELLSVDQVERSTGQDYGDSPHLNEVGPVIAQVDTRGRILDTGSVKRQVESRAEDAELEDKIDEQRIDSTKDLSEASTDDLRSKETMCQLLNAVGEEEFVGDRFTLNRDGDRMTLTSNDGRGVLLAVEGDEILSSRLERQDYCYLDGTRTKLEEIGGVIVEAPTIEAQGLELAPEPSAAGFSLE